MDRRLGAIILALALCPAFADSPRQGALVLEGFSTGNQHRKLRADARALYVAGVFDGLLYAPAFGGDEALAKALKQCVNGMNSEQVGAIVDKYLDAHPEQWHWPMSVIVGLAFADACPAFKAARAASGEKRR